jgi:flagellar biosynthesis/type III secretory pathway ATPase
MGLTSFVHLVTQMEGLHHWPDAQHPEQYLRAPHRHLFVVTAQVQVFDHDREIEINAAARWLTAVVASFAEPPPTRTPRPTSARTAASASPPAPCTRSPTGTAGTAASSAP